MTFAKIDPWFDPRLKYHYSNNNNNNKNNNTWTETILNYSLFSFTPTFKLRKS